MQVAVYANTGNYFPPSPATSDVLCSCVHALVIFLCLWTKRTSQWTDGRPDGQGPVSAINPIFDAGQLSQLTARNKKST